MKAVALATMSWSVSPGFLSSGTALLSSRWLIPGVSIASLAFLALLGAVGAKAGGADTLRATARVTFWGALAMLLTAGIGKLFGTLV